MYVREHACMYTFSCEFGMPIYNQEKKIPARGHSETLSILPFVVLKSSRISMTYHSQVTMLIAMVYTFEQFCLFVLVNSSEQYRGQPLTDDS